MGFAGALIGGGSSIIGGIINANQNKKNREYQKGRDKIADERYQSEWSNFIDQQNLQNERQTTSWKMKDLKGAGINPLMAAEGGAGGGGAGGASPTVSGEAQADQTKKNPIELSALLEGAQLDLERQRLKSDAKLRNREIEEEIRKNKENERIRSQEADTSESRLNQTITEWEDLADQRATTLRGGHLSNSEKEIQIDHAQKLLERLTRDIEIEQKGGLHSATTGAPPWTRFYHTLEQLNTEVVTGILNSNAYQQFYNMLPEPLKAEFWIKKFQPKGGK